jgi:hypothetical protein
MERQVGNPDTPQEEVHGQLRNAPTPSAAGRFSWRWAAWAGLVMLCGVALFVVFRSLQPNNGRAELPADGDNNQIPGQMFVGWDKPNKPQVAIVVSGQVYGYLQPCGCSTPQYGGLVRRYNLIESLKEKGWPVTAVDVGDIPQKSGPQTQIKYKYSMQALKILDVAAVGIGKHEMSMPLVDALALHTLNDPQPAVLAANLLNDKTHQVIQALVNDATVVQPPGAPKVGIIGLIGPTVNGKVNDQNLHFPPNNAVYLQKALEKLQKEKTQVAVLLYQGTQSEAEALATFCAKNLPNLPNLDLIVYVSDHSEPPADPFQVAGTKTQLVTTGHKGRYVGVVGVFPSAKPGRAFELKYQLVSIGPQYDTPPNKQDNHPLMKLMEEYALDVKNGNYITQFPVNMHEVQVKVNGAKYVGSQKCERCHKAEYQVWVKSGHAHAFKTLIDARHPSNRQFDGECVVCHVTGFEHHSGYGDALQIKDLPRAKMLENVGCESCHGPGSEHITDKRNEKIHAAMNPWKHRANPKLAMDVFCQKCHDVDNDVHWNFDKKWPKIVHPKAQPVNAPGAGGNNGAAKAPGVQAPNNAFAGNRETPVLRPMRDN